MVKYTYDAWGNTVTEVLDCNANVIAELNPFRYRGYYYDIETELYFLKSRYYDPELGRFMTIDDISYLDPDAINGLNLYSYCGNDAVNKVDLAGCFPISATLFIGTIVVGALFGGGISAYSSIKNGDKFFEVALKTISGAALGGMIGAAMGIGAALAAGGTIAGLSLGASVAVGIGVAVGGSAALGAVNSFINQIIDNDWNVNKVSVDRIGTDAFVAGIKGLLNFVAGAWTGGAGLWNIPKGAAPGALNFCTKLALNSIIGLFWRLSVDAIYAAILEEECGWIKFVETVMDWMF